MGEIKNLGFQIYRLRMANETSEFLLFDNRNNKYYQYNYRRGKEFLRLIIEKLYGKDLITYLINTGEIDIQNKNPGKAANDIFEKWIKEDIEIIDNINYKPIDSQIFEEDGQLYFNIYNKSTYLKNSDKYKQGNFDYITKIILNLVNNDEQAYIYFNKWLAWNLQNPLQRLATSIIFKGQQGSGKTLLTDFILKPIYSNNFIELSQADLEDDFKESLIGKQLIVWNEVIYNAKNSKYGQGLKKIVTDNWLNIKRKHRDSLYIQNYAHSIFTSNAEVPILVERGDRRFSVFKSRKLENGITLFQEFNKVKEDQIKSYIYYLLNLEVRFDEVNYPYVNNERDDVIQASYNSVELFLENVLECGGLDEMNKEYSNKDDGFFNELNILSNSQSSYVSMESLYNLYKRFCFHAGLKGVFGRNKFSAQLRHLDKTLSIIKDDNNKSIRVMKLEVDK